MKHMERSIIVTYKCPDGKTRRWEELTEKQKDALQLDATLILLRTLHPESGWDFNEKGKAEHNAAWVSTP